MSKKLSTLLVFETVVVWLRKINFSILRASTHIPLHGCCTGAIRVLHGYGTTKIHFRVAAKPDDELSKFQTDRKFAFVSKILSMLLVFETVVVWLWKMDFSILRASARIPLCGCCTGAVGLGYGISATRARKKQKSPKQLR